MNIEYNLSQGGEPAPNVNPPEQIALKAAVPNSIGKTMAGERELTTGLLAKDASFRLIVTGNIGVKEIERLIKKLELDKEILADQDNDEPEFMK